MRNPLRRYYGRGDLHFITFSCYRRLPLLGTARARNRFVRILEEVRLRHAFKLIGYVVMPEHVHLLLSEPEKGTPSKVLQVLKQKVSRAATRKRKERRARPVVVAVLVRKKGSGGVLAKTILRLQRVERGKAEREAGIYARESGETKTGRSSEGLAVEQLVALREKGRRIDRD